MSFLSILWISPILRSRNTKSIHQLSSEGVPNTGPIHFADVHTMTFQPIRYTCDFGRIPQELIFLARVWARAHTWKANIWKKNTDGENT